MLKLFIFLVIFFSGIQLYSIPISGGKIFGISLEAVRQLFFIYLFIIIMMASKMIVNINKHAKDVLIIFVLFLSYLSIKVLGSPGIFYGLTDMTKFLYVLFVFIIFYKFVSIYGIDRSIKVNIYIAFIAFLIGIVGKLLTGDTVSPDTGEFLIFGASGRAKGAIFCSIMAIYFYTSYLEEKNYRTLLFFIVSSVLIFLSFTRIAILGFIVAFFIVNIAYKKYKELLLFSTLVYILMLPFMNILIKETFIADIVDLDSLLSKDITEIFSLIRLTGRELLWSVVFDGFLENPILGNGLGYSNLMVKSVTGFIEQVHNDYLKILADLGIVGLTLYLLIYIKMFFNARKIYKINKKKRYYFFIFITTLVQILIFSFTDNIIAYAPYLLIYPFIFYLFLIHLKEVNYESRIHN